MTSIVYKEKDWEKKLAEIGGYDFYHTFCYHNVVKQEEEVPILIVFSQNEHKIAIPFIKRKIDDTYSDLTSIHGYLGPVVGKLSSNFDNRNFRREFINLLKDENIISVFSKLNPFIPEQDNVLKSLGSIEQIGELVYFDQGLDDETQKSHYNKNARRSVNKLRKYAHVKIADTEMEIDFFIQMYYATMDRLNAKNLFYFKKEYFVNLLNSKLFDAKILLAIDNETNEIMGGALCTSSNHICHIELVCTNDKYFKSSPSKLIYDEARATLKSDTIKYLVLGGGSGGREGSLMRFKSSFTQNFINFNVWKFISLPEVYEKLQTESQKSSDSNFFPKYRLNI